MKFSIKPLWTRHLTYWAIYAIYFYLVNKMVNKDFSLFTLLLMLPYFAFVFYMVVYLLKRLFGPQKYVLGVLLLLLFYSCSGILVYTVLYGQLGVNLVHGRYILRDYQFDWKQFLQSLLVMHGHFSMLAFLYFHYQGKINAVQEKLEETERRLDAENEKEQYEYTALAAQVNPHVMANVFQAWDVQFRLINPEIAVRIATMYRLMKFYMKAHEAEGPKTILLYDEVEAVKTYLEMQAYNQKGQCKVDFQVTGNLYRFAIPPTSILTLVENAFKHGDITDEENPIKIRICSEQQYYTIEVENRKRKGASDLVGHGQGLRNLRRRLEIAFASRFRFEVTETSETYQSGVRVDYTF